MSHFAKYKWYYISGAAAIAALGIYLVSRKGKKAVEEKVRQSEKDLDESGEVIPAVTVEGTSEEQGASEYKKNEKLTRTTMVIGSKGRPVGYVQAYLNYKFGSNIKVDGRYGEVMRDVMRDKLGWWCGAYWQGDSSCTITSSDDFIKAVKKLAVKKDKKWFDYLKKDKEWQATKKEYAPVSWGGLRF